MKIIPFKDLHPNTRKQYSRAKTQLLSRSAFFGSLMLQCEHIFTRDMPTMATDGRNLIINPDFIDNITNEEVRGVLVHELCHKMFLHILRAEKYYDPKAKNPEDMPKLRKWNIACDYAINPIIKEAGFSLPEGALLNSKYEGWLAEDIYKDLPDDPDQEGENHFIFSNKPLTKEEQKQLEREVKVQSAAAAAMTKDIGSLPDSIKKLLDENAKSKVDWRSALAAFIEDSISGDDDITFKRPDRRMMTHDMYLPSTEGIQIPPLCIMFDTSGSIYSYPEVTEQFVAEIKSISEHMRPEAVHFICNDTQVQSHEVFERDDEPVLKLKGGGGTDFGEAFKYIQDLGEYQPKVNIVFTDLYFNYDNLESSIPTLWVTYGDTNDQEPPFGQVLHIGDTK